MNPDFEVDVAALRAAAEDARGLAKRVAADAGEVPAPVIVPRWATADAVVLATAEMGSFGAGIAAGIAATADQIVAAVVDYEDADGEAAARLRAAARPRTVA